MNFNGKFWHKPGHLGMTTAQVKEALAGGGGDVFAVIFTYDTDHYVSNKTWAEITEAVSNGKIIIAQDRTTGDGNQSAFTSAYSYGSATGITFQFMNFSLTSPELTVSSYTISISSTDEVTDNYGDTVIFTGDPD